MLKVHWINLFAKFSVTERTAGLVTLYDIQPENGAGRAATKVGRLLVHGSNFGQMAFLPAPTTHMGTRGS